MNLTKLKAAAEAFFERYPGGFENPELTAIRKKHRLSEMMELTQSSFARRNFTSPDLVVENMVRVISRSSLVSIFEKTRFRDFTIPLSPGDTRTLAGGLEELLHGDKRIGFETMLAILETGSLAKWSVMTICQAYYHPQSEIFIKPTTTKAIINYFELENLHYRPTPTWIFSNEYCDEIDEMKSRVDPSLSPNSIAFTGFLRRSIPGRFF